MIPLAATGPDLGSAVGALVLGGLFLAYGVWHYRGHNKAVLLRTPFDSLFFSPAWLGAAVVLAGLALLLVRVPALLVLLAIPIVVCFVIALVSMFWLPDRLLPAWYLDWRARGRPYHEVASKADLKYADAIARRQARKQQRKAK